MHQSRGLSKFLFILFFWFIQLSTISAVEILDSTIKEIGKDVIKSLNKGSIICIMDFDSPTEEMSEFIQANLTSCVTDSGVIKVVTRAHMDKINKELDYQLSGEVSEETALSLCKRLGAQAILFGKFKELDNKYNLQVKMLDVETASYLLFKIYESSRSSKAEQLLGRVSSYYKAAIGASLEISKNSVKGIASGGAINFDYAFFRKFSAGLKIDVSSDAFEKDYSIFTIEPLGILRFYAVSPSGEPATGMFVELEIGGHMIFVDSKLKSGFDGGIALGYRHAINQFYIEPMVRLGYPYLFGTGVCAGMRF